MYSNFREFVEVAILSAAKPTTVTDYVVDFLIVLQRQIMIGTYFNNLVSKDLQQRGDLQTTYTQIDVTHYFPPDQYQYFHDIAIEFNSKERIVKGTNTIYDGMIMVLDVTFERMYLTLSWKTS